jgi:hypothetical protein
MEKNNAMLFLSFVLFELVFDLDGRDYNRIRALKKSVLIVILNIEIIKERI